MSEQAPRELEGYAAEPFRAARKDPLLQRAVPVAGELTSYGGGKARGDLIAGLTVAALAIPSAMAYAELAGLTPVAGLYARVDRIGPDRFHPTVRAAVRASTDGGG